MQTRPVVVFENVINDRLYRFEVMNGSPFEDALLALGEFQKSIEVAKEESEKKAAEAKEQPAAEQPVVEPEVV